MCSVFHLPLPFTSTMVVLVHFDKVNISGSWLITTWKNQLCKCCRFDRSSGTQTVYHPCSGRAPRKFAQGSYLLQSNWSACLRQLPAAVGKVDSSCWRDLRFCCWVTHPDFPPSLVDLLNCLYLLILFYSIFI